MARPPSDLKRSSGREAAGAPIIARIADTALEAERKRLGDGEAEAKLENSLGLICNELVEPSGIALQPKRKSVR
jgi:hypothetical protein